MESNELETLIKLRKFATELLTDRKPTLEIKIDGEPFSAKGNRARDIGNGMMIAIQAMELSAGI